MCTHYFSDDMLRWYFKQERKNNWDHSHFNQFQWLQVPFSFSKYRSHSAGTVLWLIFDEQVPSLQICITVLFSADLQTPRTALPGFPTTLPVFQNVSTHFFYPYAHSVDASFTPCRLNRQKWNTYRETRPPSWENGTWQVPSQLSHSAIGAVAVQNAACTQISRAHN